MGTEPNKISLENIGIACQGWVLKRRNQKTIISFLLPKGIKTYQKFMIIASFPS